MVFGFGYFESGFWFLGILSLGFDFQGISSLDFGFWVFRVWTLTFLFVSLYICLLVCVFVFLGFFCPASLTFDVSGLSIYRVRFRI